MSDIIVIGAGLIGLSVARRLSAEGHSVTVVAPEVEDHMASPGNAGTIAAYAVDPVGTPDVLRDLPRLLFSRSSPLAIHHPSALSLAPWLLRFAWESRGGAAARNRSALAALLDGAEDRWRAFAADLALNGTFRNAGAFYAYDTPARAMAARAGLDRRRSLGVSVREIDGPTLESLEPGLPKGRFAGAALFEHTMWTIDPPAILARLALTNGAARSFARAHAIEERARGWRVVLGTGQTLDAEYVVLAAGAWSGRLLRPLGIRLPITAERGYHLEFEGVAPLTRPLCPTTYGFYFTPMDGRLRVAGTVELGGIGAPPSPHRWDRLLAGARSVFPDLPEPTRRWMGLRPSIPDSLPMIGAVRPGLITAFGHGHIGLTLAPITAELVASAVAGKPLPVSVSPRRFG